MKPNDFDHRPFSRAGVACCFLGGAMFLAQPLVIGAVLIGVKDGHGIDYAISWPFMVYLCGIPLGIFLAVAGFSPKSDRSTSEFGLLLTLAGPLLFFLFVLSALSRE